MDRPDRRGGPAIPRRRIMAAAAVTGLVSEAMRKIVSRRMGAAPLAASVPPVSTIVSPRRWSAQTKPGRSPRSTWPAITRFMRARRAAENPPLVIADPFFVSPVPVSVSARPPAAPPKPAESNVADADALKRARRSSFHGFRVGIIRSRRHAAGGVRDGLSGSGKNRKYGSASLKTRAIDGRVSSRRK